MPTAGHFTFTRGLPVMVCPCIIAVVWPIPDSVATSRCLLEAYLIQESLKTSTSAHSIKYWI